MTTPPPGRLPVAVDAMGGDSAPGAIVEGALRARDAGFPVVLVGDEALIRPLLPSGDVPEVVHAPAAVPMDAVPTITKRDEPWSIRAAMRLVAAGRACAAVSCGNSGATLVSAVLELGTMPGVDRPAIVVSLPRTDGGALHVLDVGASVDCRATHLLTFAGLGAAWARVQGVPSPRIGLLSVGHEPGKGNRLVREAHELLASSSLRFVGNLEPDAALAGAADVLVCDGFTGNVLIKTAEGVVSMVRALAARRVGGSLRARAGMTLAGPALDAATATLDWRRQGGALLLGVPAPVVVGHGRADPEAAGAAVRLAHYASEGRVVDEVGAALAMA